MNLLLSDTPEKPHRGAKCNRPTVKLMANQPCSIGPHLVLSTEKDKKIRLSYNLFDRTYNLLIKHALYNLASLNYIGNGQLQIVRNLARLSAVVLIPKERMPDKMLIVSKLTE